MSANYTFFTTSNIKPKGWLRRQLEIQAQGLCGNLDRVWRDIRESAWIGGDCEGWERVPYWLDGVVPLAYLLQDEDLINRARHYIDCILERQEPDGWICPVPPEKRREYDTWAVLLISKALMRYYECSHDERIPDVLYRMMKNYYTLLSSGDVNLRDWGKHRWYEGFPALNFLWSRNPEPWIRELAKLLSEKGMDYRTVEKQWERPLNKWTFDTHIVNLCEMLKSEVLSCDLLGTEVQGLAEHFYQKLKQYNGTAVGTFTGDECLSGLSPTQGTELCSVVELMDSMEQLYAYTGAPEWAERLEVVAFNALPATLTQDMWAHQYVQMVNQIDCTPFPGQSHFRTVNREAHRFGLEPNFGCCTANFGQGFPKLTLSAWMGTKDGALSAVALPSELNVEWNGVPVTATLETDYPFRNFMRYRIYAQENTDFVLSVRIPSFAKNLTVNGKTQVKRDILKFGGFAKGETVIDISFDLETHLMARPHGMFAMRRGSLVFALPVRAEITRVEYERDGVERKYPYCDYDYKTASDWNLAFAGKDFRVAEHPIGEFPFSESEPPVTIEVPLCHVAWEMADGYETVPAWEPKNCHPLDAPTVRKLIPYGCTKLRMTEIKMVRQQERT